MQIHHDTPSQRRAELRRALFSVLADLGTWDGEDLLALIKLPPSRLNRGDGFVRQIILARDAPYSINLLIEIVPNPPSCGREQSILSVSVSDGSLIEASEVHIDGPVVRLVDSIQSFGS